MKRIILTSLLFFCFAELNAAEGGPCKDYGECDQFKPALNDIASLQSGASVFLNYCYGCHSLKFSRWNRVAADLEIPESLFFENLVFEKPVFQALEKKFAVPTACQSASLRATS